MSVNQLWENCEEWRVFWANDEKIAAIDGQNVPDVQPFGQGDNACIDEVKVCIGIFGQKCVDARQVIRLQRDQDEIGKEVFQIAHMEKPTKKRHSEGAKRPRNLAKRKIHDMT